MEKNRINNFDVLKIFSATLIVFHHYQQVSDVSFDGINFYGGKIVWGYLVELFFIISGFLAAMTIRRGESLVKSVAKKISRLLPMAFLAVLSNFVITIIYKHVTSTLLFGETYSYAQVITSLFLVNQGWIIEFFPAINNPIWYLCVLMWVSIVYIFIKNIVKENYRAEIIISLCFVFLGIIGWRLYNKYGFDIAFLHGSDFRGYATFFMGIVLYHIYSRITRRQILYLSMGLLLVSIFGLLFLGLCNWYVLVLSFFPCVVLVAVIIPQINIPIQIWGGYRMKYICGICQFIV